MTEVKSGMDGTVFEIPTEEGDHVEAGDPVIVLEAMKMEVNVEATTSGTITEILVEEGDHVEEHDTLAKMEAD